MGIAHGICVYVYSYTVSVCVRRTRKNVVSTCGVFYYESRRRRRRSRHEFVVQRRSSLLRVEELLFSESACFLIVQNVHVRTALLRKFVS